MNREIEIKSEHLPSLQRKTDHPTRTRDALQTRLRPEVHCGRHPPAGDPLHRRPPPVRGLQADCSCRDGTRGRDKHLHGLKSWAMYQHVVHRISFAPSGGHVRGLLRPACRPRGDLHRIKSLMANRYRTTWRRILARIVGGGLAHADETHVNLQKGKGYVWVLTNLEDVVYMYRPNREADFLQDLLRDFKGVLVIRFLQRLRLAALRAAEVPRPPHPGLQRRPDGQPLRRGVQGPGRGVRQAAAVHRRHDRPLRPEETAPAQAQG